MNALRHTILGLFFFVTMALLGYVTIYLGDVMTSTERTTLVAWFDTVDGLGAGDPVMIRGVQSGRVTSVRVAAGESDDARRPLRVEFMVKQQLVLHDGYQIAIGSPSLLGGKEIEILEGGGAPLPAEAYGKLIGASDANLMRNLAGILDENRDDVRSIVRSVAHIADDLDQGRRSLMDIALPKASGTDLTAAIASGLQLVQKLGEGDGSFAKLVNSPELHDSAKGFFDEGGRVLADARTGDGPVNALLHDAKLTTQLKSGVAGIAAAGERLGRGEGLLGKLTTAESEATWRDIAEIAADGRSLIGDVRAGKGAVGRFFSDPALEQQVVDVIGRFAGITNDVAVLVDAARRGRGVVGLLFADDQARRNVERIIDQVGRAIEDAREAAPVSSVASFLFGQL
ncbi:MAG: MCE family protein [Planctomycetes bacterium]|nr:MCE family protein [Planctomycetota bacterium]